MGGLKEGGDEGKPFFDLSVLVKVKSEKDRESQGRKPDMMCLVVVFSHDRGRERN